VSTLRRTPTDGNENPVDGRFQPSSGMNRTTAGRVLTLRLSAVPLPETRRPLMARNVTLIA